MSGLADTYRDRLVGRVVEESEGGVVPAALIEALRTIDLLAEQNRLMALRQDRLASAVQGLEEELEELEELEEMRQDAWALPMQAAK